MGLTPEILAGIYGRKQQDAEAALRAELETYKANLAAFTKDTRTDRQKNLEAYRTEMGARPDMAPVERLDLQRQLGLIDDRQYAVEYARHYPDSPQARQLLQGTGGWVNPYAEEMERLGYTEARLRTVGMMMDQDLRAVDFADKITRTPVEVPGMGVMELTNQERLGLSKALTTGNMADYFHYQGQGGQAFLTFLRTMYEARARAGDKSLAQIYAENLAGASGRGEAELQQSLRDAGYPDKKFKLATDALDPLAKAELMLGGTGGAGPSTARLSFFNNVVKSIQADIQMAHPDATLLPQPMQNKETGKVHVIGMLPDGKAILVDITAHVPEGMIR